MKTRLPLTSFCLGAFLFSSLVAQATNPVLTIRGLNPNGGDNTAFIDQVEILAGASGTTVVAGAVANNSFETSDPLAQTSYGYVPTGGVWAFGGGTGIAVENGNGFDPPATANGTRVAFLQGASQLQQTLTLAPGTYRVRLTAAQRIFPTVANTQQLQVLLDGVVYATFTPTTSTSYTATITGAFTVGNSTPFAATALLPTRNDLAIARNSSVALTFSEAVNAASAANVNIFSSQLGGLRTVPATVSGNGVSFQPNLFFKAGEVISVTLPNTVVSNALGQASNAAQVYQFTVATQNNGTGNGTFSGTQNLTTGSDPGSVAAGDIDGDGKLDLVLVNRSSNTVSVLRNTGTSGALSFATKVDFALPAGAQPVAVALGDVDGDGDLDIATANYTSDNVSLLQNRIAAPGSLSSSSFASPVNVATGAGPSGIAFGDLDADGDLDLVTANFDGSSATVLRNTILSAASRASNGLSTAVTFVAANFISSTLPTGTNPASVALGDLDNDGLLDIAISQAPTNTVALFRNTTAAPNAITFTARQIVNVGATPYGVAIGDLDGDGKQDVVTANSDATTLTLLRNTTAGTTFTSFTITTSSITVGNGPISVALADVNADGRLDLVAANYNNGTGTTISTVLRNAANTGFLAQTTTAVSTAPRDVVTADLDGDGDVDLATASLNADRASVRINGTSSAALPLPVELVSFTAECGTTGTALAWRTASEKQNQGFEVQRSMDSNTFTTVGYVAGYGTSASGHRYSYVDQAPAGLQYYRLRQLDTDGRETFSPVATASCAATAVPAQRLTLVPNPATTQVRVLGAVGAVTILDATGRIMATQAAGETVSLVGLTPGLYLVRSGNQTARLVVE